MSKPPSLYLHEETLLLSLNDDSGKTQGAWFLFGMGGAILAELLLAERVSIEKVKKTSLLVVNKATGVGEPILDECLLRVSTAKRRAAVSTWIGRFAGTPKLKQRVAERLCLRGILKRADARVLFVFSRQVFPTVDAEPERELIRRMSRAIFEDGNVDERTATVVMLAHKAGLLRHIYGAQAVKERKSRIEGLPLPAHLATSIQEAIAAAEAAITATMIAIS